RRGLADHPRALVRTLRPAERQGQLRPATRTRGGEVMTQTIPNEYPGLIPYLSIRGAAQAIDFYQRAFAAELAYRLDAPGGRVAHAELGVGKACCMLDGPYEDCEQTAAARDHPAAIGLYLYEEDVSSCFAQSLQAGAEQVMAVHDMCYG